MNDGQPASRVSRRAFLRFTSGGALAAGALPVLLAACNVAPAASTSTPVTAAKSTAASKAASAYPTYAPIQGGAKPDFPSAGPEYEDGFAYYPRDPAPAWLKAPPGKGSTVNALTLRLSALPATPVDQNPAWQEVNKQLNATVSINNPIASDYPARIATVMAGNDLPDIMLFNGGLTGVANLPAFLEKSIADLTPYLAGDASKDYPFLAGVPTYAWKNSGCVYNGKLYMWPLQRYLPGTAFIRNVDIWDKEIGPNYLPKSADDFKRILVQLTNQQAGQYAIGGSAGVISGGAAGLDSVTRLFPQVFGAPNNWRLDPASGKLTKDYETPEFKQALAYVADLVSSGVFFPDTLTNPSGPTTSSFPTGKAAMTILAFGVTWTSMWSAMRAIQPTVNWLPLSPFPAVEGGKPVHYLGPGFLVTLGMKQAPPERIKELLGIVDWLTAPFGSAEDFLLTYGLPGTDNTLDANGRPLTTQRTSADVDAVGWKYISQRPQVMTFPGWPDYAKIGYDYEHAVIPVGISDPTLGLVSATAFAKGVPLNKTVTDAAADIILSRRPVSDFDQVVADWRTNGGDQIRTELQKALAAQQ